MKLIILDAMNGTDSSRYLSNKSYNKDEYKNGKSAKEM